MDGAIIDEIFESLIDAVDEMKNSMTNSNYNLDEIKQRISKIISPS
jgi:hypothetical protein